MLLFLFVFLFVCFFAVNTYRLYISIFGVTVSMTGLLLTCRKPRHTLVIDALRKKNYSLFLEYTFDMNNRYSFLLRKINK